jgi:hypothetical protein
MSLTRGEHPDLQLLFLQELTNADVASHVVEIASGIWAIHGDVIMAEFDSYDQARTVLNQLLHWTARSSSV